MDSLVNACALQREKSWLALRSQRGHCSRVGETGEGLEGYTLEEGGQGCYQETRER